MSENADNPSNQSDEDEGPSYSQEISRQKSVNSSITTKVSPEIPLNIDFIRDKGYTLLEQIGEGKFSTVFKATCNTMPGVNLACKRIKTEDVDEEWKEKCLDRELIIAKNLKHKNIVEVYKVFRSDRVVYIFMQIAENGSIRDYMTKNKRPVLEMRAKIWWAGLMAGLAYMHTKGMAHRDIKLDNFLLDSAFNALLSDFGFAVYDEKRPQKLLRETMCGTIDYMAPEVFDAGPKAPYDAKTADIYSMGICLYEMLNYDNPYNSKNVNLSELNSLKRKRSYRFHKKIGDILSESIKDLINKLLEPDPHQRITVQSILQHKALN